MDLAAPRSISSFRTVATLGDQPSICRLQPTGKRLANFQLLPTAQRPHSRACASLGTRRPKGRTTRVSQALGGDLQGR